MATLPQSSWARCCLASRLGAHLPARAALLQAAFNIQRTHPEFKPRYDAGFFFEGAHMGSTLVTDPLAEEIHAMAADGGRRPVGIPTASMDETASHAAMQHVGSRARA